MEKRIKIKSMEHFDQNESNGNAATKYVIEFTSPVNCEWLWLVLEDALGLSQKKIVVDLQTGKQQPLCETE